MEKKTHPTIARYKEAKQQGNLPEAPEILSSDWLKELVIEAGADDVGIVSAADANLQEEREEIAKLSPAAKSLISIVCRLNRENIRCLNRSVSDLEFLQTFDRANEVAQKVVALLEKKGVRALYPSAGFPMDMAQWPGKMWALSHKTVAVAAGMGVIGLSRLVLHPRFGGFITLGTVLINVSIDNYDQPLDYSPCIDCKLCAAVCPVGAINPNGHFNFANCMTHNYRDRAGGFQGWVENIVTSKKVPEYRKKVSDKETVSMWQSLSYGICNKSSYCMAACPAGEDVIGPYLEDRKGYMDEFVKRYQNKEEMVFVIPSSDGEAHVKKTLSKQTAKDCF